MASESPLGIRNPIPLISEPVHDVYDKGRLDDRCLAGERKICLAVMFGPEGRGVRDVPGIYAVLCAEIGGEMKWGSVVRTRHRNIALGPVFGIEN